MQKKGGIDKCEGQITIFVLLIFMIVVSLLASQYRSALFYACRADAERAARLSVDSFLAAYHRPLKERYEILAVDGGFGQDAFCQEVIESQLLQVFENNMQSSMVKNQTASMELSGEPIFTFLVEGDWELFLREITLNRQETLVIDSVEYIVDQWQKQNDYAYGELEQKRSDAENAEISSDANADDKEEITAENVQDPRDFVMNIWNQGILKAACPGDFDVSEKEVQMADVSFPEASEQVNLWVDFKNDSSIQRLLSSWEDVLKPDMFMDMLSEDFVVQSYIKDMFRSAVSKHETSENEPNVLNYEMEYIIGGHEQDRENLKTVLWKILALRCVFNLSYLLSSVEKENQVMVTASTLSLALVIPQFTEVIAFLLKVAWAFAESLADCRTLLNGGKVPLVKNDTTWYLTWNQMLQLHTGLLDGNTSEEGLDYDTYLQVLLMFTKSDTKCRRMTHIMEKNIQMLPGYSGFKMKNCIYGIQAEFICDFKGFGQYRVQTALSY